MTHLVGAHRLVLEKAITVSMTQNVASQADDGGIPLKKLYFFLVEERIEIRESRPFRIGNPKMATIRIKKRTERHTTEIMYSVCMSIYIYIRQ